MRKKSNENYLDKKPLRSPLINWSTDENGTVTLEVENRGIANRIAQKLFKKPKISYIHLDEMGSFIWQAIDGEENLITLGEKIKAHFGENAEPIYERLAQYVKTLESYKFIEFKD